MRSTTARFRPGISPSARDTRREGENPLRSTGRHLLEETVQVVRSEPPDEPLVLLIRSHAHDDALEYTHAFITSFTRARYRSGVAQRLSLATYELLGNALSYGSMVAEVSFALTETAGSASVRVSNETFPGRIEMLTAHLEVVRENAEAAFFEGMRRTAMGGVAVPMLGLARLVHEAKLNLEAYLRLGMVTVVARAAL